MNPNYLCAAVVCAILSNMVEASPHSDYVVWNATFERPTDGRTFRAQSISKRGEALADAEFLLRSLPDGWDCSEFKLDPNFVGVLAPDAYVFRFSITVPDSYEFSDFMMDFKSAVHSLCSSVNIVKELDPQARGSKDWWPISFHLESKAKNDGGDQKLQD